MPPFSDPEIYRDILDELQIGVSVLDLDGKIAFWSDGAEKITGYTRLEVLGHLCTENILPHCNHDSCEMCVEHCPLIAALHGARPVESIGSIHHKSAYWAPVHGWAIPLRDKHGSNIGLIQTFENEFSVNGPDPNDRSMKERGCLDPATELPNRAMMQSHLREALATFAELKIPVGVIYLEVQALEPFRARYGQEAATTILRALARTLRNSVWPTDFVGRWSGDRFLVILCGCDEEALRAVGARILRITGKVTIHWWGEELSVATLMGWASAAAGDSIESLLERSCDAVMKTYSTDAQSAAGSSSSSNPQ
jgi:diguanylate cyclase (GGDEF)-like protein/PAS domain S-box-containing protein